MTEREALRLIEEGRIAGYRKDEDTGGVTIKRLLAPETGKVGLGAWGSYPSGKLK